MRHDTQVPSRPTRRHLGDERGVALIIALLAMTLMTALGMALMLVSETETLIGANYRDSVEGSYVADAGIERVMQDVLSIPDWNTILTSPDNVRAGVTSGFIDSTVTPTLADGRTINLISATNMINATASIRGLLIANITMAVANNISTMASSTVIPSPTAIAVHASTTYSSRSDSRWRSQRQAGDVRDSRSCIAPIRANGRRGQPDRRDFRDRPKYIPPQTPIAARGSTTGSPPDSAPLRTWRPADWGCYPLRGRRT